MLRGMRLKFAGMRKEDAKNLLDEAMTDEAVEKLNLSTASSIITYPQ